MKKGTLLALFVLLSFLGSAQSLGYRRLNIDKPKLYDYVYIDTLVAGGDGYKLVTELYLPKGEGPWPVVVYRSPYIGFPAGDRMDGYRQLAECGIGFVVQRCRGTGGSEGTFEPNIYEREDGLALLDWLQQADWVKSIALTGCSYMGMTSWILADALPDKVKGIYLEHYGVDRHLSAYSSGMFRQDILTAWAIDNAKEPITKPKTTDRTSIYYNEMRYMPQLEMDENMLGAKLPWYRDWISHTEYTDPYWHESFWALLKSIPPKIDVPITVVAGHFDHHMEGTLLGYEMLSPETKAKSRLVVGGWNHGFQTTPALEGIKNDKQLDIDIDTFNWLYELLIEERVPKHEVKVYAIGADRWLDLEEWPAESAKTTTLYLGSSENNIANLVATPAEGSDKMGYDYDPTNPVISAGGETLFNSNSRKGSIRQPEVGYRDDVLFYRSEPLKEAMMISGKIKANVWFSSDCNDTAVTVKISEERADGSTWNIRTGIATLAFREDKLGPRGTYTPGEVVEVEVEMLPIVWEIQPGSRIRVDISSSDFPQYSIHSNYAGPWAEQTRTRIAHQSVFSGKEYPSSIEIPLLEE